MSKSIKLKFEFGTQAKDVITGFKGTVTGFCCYLTGCDQYCLTPKADKNKVESGRWYDVNRLQPVRAKKIDLNTKKEKGAMDSPKAY